VFSIAGQQVERVGQNGQGGQQGTGGSGGLAGNVEDDACAEGSAEAAAERGERGGAAAVGAHHFGNAVEQTIADGEGRLGGNVAGGDSGASGGDDEAGLGGGFPQCVLDGSLLVWNYKQGNRFESVRAQDESDGGSGKVFPLAAGARVADGNYGCGLTLFGHLFDCTNCRAITNLMRK